MKNFKRIFCLIMALVLTVALCACGEEKPTEQPSDTPNSDENIGGEIPGDTADEAEEPTHNYAAGFEKFKPEDIVMTVNDRDVTWQDFYYFVQYYITYVEMYVGTVTDFDVELAEGVTFQDYVINGAAEWMKYSEAIAVKAKELGVELDAEDEAAIQAQWDSISEQYGSKEAFIEEMASFFCTEELYNFMLQTTRLSDKCLAELYGVGGADLTLQQLEEYNAESGYLMAKHILVSKTYKDEDGNEVSYTEDELADRIALAEDIRAQILAADDLDAKFDELMNTYSEDPGGLLMYPDGYLFVEGDMVTEFYEGTKALEIGAVSELIETPYGYHIIYRLPIDYDATPSQYSSYMMQGSTDYTLRALTARAMFDEILATWTAEVKVAYTDIMEQINLNEMLAFG